jgi:hypothetical protein
VLPGVQWAGHARACIATCRFHLCCGRVPQPVPPSPPPSTTAQQGLESNYLYQFLVPNSTSSSGSSNSDTGSDAITTLPGACWMNPRHAAAAALPAAAAPVRLQQVAHARPQAAMESRSA